MFNDIGWTKKIVKIVFRIPKRSRVPQKKFPRGQWSLLGQAQEEKWYETYTYKLEGKWNSTAAVMLDIFKKKTDRRYSVVSVR